MNPQRDTNDMWKKQQRNEFICFLVVIVFIVITVVRYISVTIDDHINHDRRGNIIDSGVNSTSKGAEACRRSVAVFTQYSWNPFSVSWHNTPNKKRINNL